MKTKKTSKILSVVLTLAVLVCSLSVVSGFVTTAATNSEESALIDNLKTAWQAMYTETKIADLNSENAVGSFWNSEAPSTMGFTFNSDNTVNKTAANYHDTNIGIVFKNEDQDGSAWFDKGNRFCPYSEVFDDSKYDMLSVTFNTGTVTAAGNVYLLCTYSDYNSVKSAEISVTPEDSNKTVTLDTKKLFGKKLSELLLKKDKDKVYDLKIIKIGFSKNLAFEGAKISGLNAWKYAELPENSDSMTAFELYNKAKEINAADYINSTDFVAARAALEDYLKPEILKDELKTAWGSMYTNDFFATLKSEGNINAITEKSDTVIENPNVDENKTYATGDEVLGLNLNGTYYGLTFYDKGGKFQCLGLSGKIKNYDTITLSFYTGTITSGGILQFGVVDGSWSTAPIQYDLKVSDSGKWIDVDVLESLGYTTMSDFVNREDTGKNPSFMNVGFLNGLKAEGVIIGMVAGKTFTKLPDNSDSMTAFELYNKAKEINAADYINSTDFVAARAALEDYLKPEIMKDELKTAWGSMYALTDIGAAEHAYKIGELNTTKSTSEIPDDIKDQFADNYYFFDKAACNNSSFNINVNAFRNLEADSNGHYQDYSLYNNEALFTNNDDIQFKFYTGTVNTAGTLKVRIFYTNWKAKDKEYTIDTSNQLITVSLKEIVGKKTLAECFSLPFDDSNEHKASKVCFQLSNELVGTGMIFGALTTKKYAVAPGETDNELLAGRARRVDTAAFENTAEFADKRTAYCEYLMTGKTLGDVNGSTGVDICDLVALSNLMLTDYNEETTYSITGDMDSDGYIKSEDTSLLRKALLNN